MPSGASSYSSFTSLFISDTQPVVAGLVQLGLVGAVDADLASRAAADLALGESLAVDVDVLRVRVVEQHEARPAVVMPLEGDVVEPVGRAPVALLLLHARVLTERHLVPGPDPLAEAVEAHRPTGAVDHDQVRLGLRPFERRPVIGRRRVLQAGRGAPHGTTGSETSGHDEREKRSGTDSPPPPPLHPHHGFHFLDR